MEIRKRVHIVLGRPHLQARVSANTDIPQSKPTQTTIAHNKIFVVTSLAKKAVPTKKIIQR